jgi:hypothetical protein
MLVTEMKMDSDSDTPKLTFKPVGFLNKDQWEAAKMQGSTNEAKSAVVMTATQTDAKPKAIAAPAVQAEAAVEAPIPEPTKKAAKKSAEEPTAKKDLASIMGEWATDDQ